MQIRSPRLSGNWLITGFNFFHILSLERNVIESCYSGMLMSCVSGVRPWRRGSNFTGSRLTEGCPVISRMKCLSGRTARLLDFGREFQSINLLRLSCYTWSFTAAVMAGAGSNGFLTSRFCLRNLRLISYGLPTWYGSSVPGDRLRYVMNC